MQQKEQPPPRVELVTAQDYRDSAVVRHYGNMTMSKAMNSGMPSLTKWKKIKGEDEIIRGVSMLIQGTSLYFDKPMPPQQCEAVAIKLLSNYELSNLKLEDLVVCCKEITESTTFGKLTPNKILSHIKNYAEQRTAAAIADSLDSVQNSKLYDGNMHERIDRTVRQTAKDKTAAVERTRDSVKKYYK